MWNYFRQFLITSLKSSRHSECHQYQGECHIHCKAFFFFFKLAMLEINGRDFANYQEGTETWRWYSTNAALVANSLTTCTEIPKSLQNALIEWKKNKWTLSKGFKNREGNEEDRDEREKETKTIYRTMKPDPLRVHSYSSPVREDSRWAPPEQHSLSISHRQYSSDDLNQSEASAHEHLNKPTSSTAISVPKLVILRTPQEQAQLEY